MICNFNVLCTTLAILCIGAMPYGVRAAETNADQPMRLEMIGPGPGEVGLMFNQNGLPKTVIRPLETLSVNRSEDKSTSAALAVAIVNALVSGPDKQERAGGIEGFLPAGTTLGNVEVIGTNTIKVYLDMPADFVQSSETYTPAFVEEVARNFINSLWGTGLNEIYFYVKDPAAGEYKQIRDFL